MVEDFDCVAEIKTKYKDCLKSCEGIYADVIKSDIDFVELDGIKQMVKKYETYKHLNESYVRFPNELKGESKNIYIFLLTETNLNWLY